MNHGSANDEKNMPGKPAVPSKWNYAVIAVFFTMIYAFGAWRILAPTPTVSEYENRALKPMPAFGFTELFKGRFTKQLDDFYADTFILRDFFIQAGDIVSLVYKVPVPGVVTVLEADANVEDTQGLEELEGPETAAPVEAEMLAEASAVAEAGDDVQPPSEGPSGVAPASAIPTEDTISASAEPTVPPSPGEPADMQQKGSYLITDEAVYRALKADPRQYGKWAGTVNRIHAALPGCRVVALIPPESYALYAPAKYYKPEYDQQKAILDAYALLDPGVVRVDAYSRLAGHTGEYIYFRTDHHWTARGAYWGYTAVAGALGFVPRPLDEAAKGVVKDKFLGSYYRQFKDTAKARLLRKNPDVVEYFTPSVGNSAMAYENATMDRGKKAPVIMLDKIPNNVNYYRTFLGGDYPCMHISTDVKNGQSVVIVKDSYANALVPFLLPHYEEIYVIDYRDYNVSGKPGFLLADFVAKHPANDVMVISSFDMTNSSLYMNWLARVCP